MLIILSIVLVPFGLRVTAYAITGVSAGVNNVTGQRPFRLGDQCICSLGRGVGSLHSITSSAANQPERFPSCFQIAGNFLTAHGSLYHTRLPRANAKDTLRASMNTHT